MTEHMMAGGTSLAEPPVPMAPASSEPVTDDNRRKLAIVGAVVGALVLLVAAFFLLKGHGSGDQALAPVTRGVPPTAQNGGGSATAQHPIRLPKTFNGAVGRDPFAPLYTPPKPKASAPASTPSGPSSNPKTPVVVTPTGSGNTGGSGNPGTTPAASYAPVWVELVSVKGTKSATFVVDYSNGKRTKTTTFKGVPAPTKTLRTTFGHVFALLSIQDGTATVQFGDGTPFDLATGFGNRHFVG